MENKKDLPDDAWVQLGLPATKLQWLTAKPWLRVEASEEPWIRLHGKRLPLEFYPIAATMTDQQLSEFSRFIRDQGGGRQLKVIVASRLRTSARAVLEQNGVGFLDAQGHIHLPLPGGLIHIEPAATGKTQRRATPGIGPNGIRAIQVLLEETELIQISHLAARSQLSLSQTHAVLTALEAAGLLRSSGTGPTRRRTIVDHTALLDWLASQPSARRRERQVEAYVYARRPEDLWRLLDEQLTANGVAHALTGAAASAVYGVGPTALPITTLRISPEVPLEAAVTMLGAESTTRGANLRLLRDTGQVGSMNTAMRHGIHLAPKSRIYLDLLSEKRGEDLAQQFREVILGY